MRINQIYLKMWNIIVILLVVLVAYLAYILWIRPVRMMRSYAKFMKAQGYKVFEVPYNLTKDYFTCSIVEGIQKGDPMIFYKQVAGYDVVVSNDFNKPVLDLFHPDLLKDFYSVDKHYCYPKEERVKNVFIRLLGTGLLLSEGTKWKRKRTILNSIFNFEYIKSQSHKISRICSESMSELEAKSAKKTDHSVSYNIEDLAVRIFSQVIMECFFGATNKQLINGQSAGMFLKRLMDDLAIQSESLVNFLLGPKILSLGLTRSHKQIQDRVQAYRSWAFGFIKRRIQEINEKIEKGEKQKEGSDIIQAFLRAKKTVQNEKDAISSVQEIFQEINTFFFGGTDTTTNFTQMMIYLIATHPQTQAKVRKQIQTHMKDDDYSYANLKNLTYIDLIQKETTRFYGPINNLFHRVANVDNYINGLPVKKGTLISIMFYGNHHSEKYFKNPEEFRPERWVSECDNIPPFAIGGFSAGARTCIGKHLAHLESKIALVKFFKRYKKITLDKPDFKMQYKFLYGPEVFESTMIIDEGKHQE